MSSSVGSFGYTVSSTRLSPVRFDTQPAGFAIDGTPLAVMHPFTNVLMQDIDERLVVIGGEAPSFPCRNSATVASALYLDAVLSFANSDRRPQCIVIL